MFYWTFVYFVLALIVGFFGFTGLVRGSETLIWLFWIFLGLCMINFIIALIRRWRKPKV